MDDRPENEIPNCSPEPMSLNQRLHHQLSRNRRPVLAPNPNPNPIPIPIPENIRVKQKDQLPGRRRLCKTNEEASPQNKEEDKEENISDILDEFSFRLASLSLHKEKPSKDEREKERSPVEDYFSSKEGEEEGEFDEYSFKVMPRNMKNRYFSDEESEVIDEGEEVAHKKSTVAEYFSDEEEVVEVEEFTKGEGEVGTAENDSIKSRNQGLEVEPCVYRSMGRTTKGSYFSEDDEFEEIENITGVTGLPVNGLDPEEAEEEEEEGDFTLPLLQEGKVRVYKLSNWVYSKLYPHQKEGINWLWGLHCKGTGGILGDDMGLGKTMQISAFLAGLFHSGLIKRAMIVAPKTLISHWFKELSVVGLSEKARDFSGTNVNVRNSELSNILEEGGILITTYDIVRNNYKAIRGGDKYQEHDLYDEEDEMIWDYVILDEGHIIKNPKTQRAQSLSEIPSGHRIIISGTPIQNNLKELWALFYFCCPEVLGDKDEFKDRYEKKILRGNEKNASDREKYVGSTVARELRERIKPYFLRRLKSEVFGKENVETKVEMPKKNELIVWLKLTTCQRQLYEAFLNSELVHNAVGGSPLAAITIMKKICDHPLLLTKRGAEEILEGIEEMNENDKGLIEKLATSLANQHHDNKFLNMDYTVSCKITFVLSLLGNLMEEGHIVLIFSQSRKMLDLIQEAIWSKGYKLLRIDGTTKISERERIVKDFQDGEGAPIFLLTTQVGGLGLTLTKANRVIVIDPAWNPSMDNQSVDRAYRIGQTKDVIVYRLMTCGTIEEVIYKKQVFKGGLFKTATEQKEQTRYFSRKDIEEVFRLPEEGFNVSVTHRQLQEEHAGQVVMDEYLTSHIEYLENQDIAGVSHHSLLFSKTAIVPVVPETSEQPESSFGNRIIRSSAAVASSQSEYFPYGAAYAQKPRDFIQNTRMESPAYQVGQSPGEIRDKINRLKITLGNKDLVAKLPDRGERMRNQLAELQLKFIGTSDSSPVNLLSSEKKRGPEVISVDEIADNLDILSV